MKESTSREKVLKKVRAALLNRMPAPYDSIDTESNIYYDEGEFLDVKFAEAFAAVSGQFVFCEDHADLLVQLDSLIKGRKYEHVYCREAFVKEILDQAGISHGDNTEALLNAQASVTGCEYLVSRFGSIVVSSRQGIDRKGFFHAPVHIIIADTSQLVIDLKNALIGLKMKYWPDMPSFISVITGPSRTADIEKTLVMGAHGPKEIFVFLLEKDEKQ